MATKENKLDAILQVTTLVADRLERVIQILEANPQKLPGKIEPLEFSGTPETGAANFSESLSRTISALMSVNKRRAEPTAENVASITKRSRNAESANLNKLATMGWCTRLRIGRKVIYRLTRR
jgi:hypothetical protein